MKIIYNDELEKKYKQQVIKGLDNEARRKRNISSDTGSFSFVMLDEGDEFVGGMQGHTYYGCCHIDLLYIREDRRKQGHGAKFLQQAEDIARKRNCAFMTVNTMDFQAKPFYEKHGFNLEFTRHGYEKNSLLFTLRKEL